MSVHFEDLFHLKVVLCLAFLVRCVFIQSAVGNGTYGIRANDLSVVKLRSLWCW